MKPIVSFIAALFTVSLFTQCTPKASSEQPRSNIDIAEEIMDEIYDTYPDSAWIYESYLVEATILKAGVLIDHQGNDSLKFLDLVTRINQKIESIDSYRIFSDRQNDDKGIFGRYVVSIRPDREGDKSSTLFYKYQRATCSCPHNKKDTISFVFTVNAGTNKDVTQDIQPGLRSSTYVQSEIPSAEDIKPLEDLFQEQYNDSRAIRHQDTYIYNPETNITYWAVIFPNHAVYKEGDTFTTNVLYSQRPVNDIEEVERWLRLAERYKHSDMFDVFIASGGKGASEFHCLEFCFIDNKGIRYEYIVHLQDGIFSVMKATAADEKGLCIEADWWK